VIVESKRRRSTGTVVTIEDGEHHELEPGYHFITVCEEHASLIEHRTITDAHTWAPHPEEWCEHCAVLAAAGVKYGQETQE
jgi:hypothetical protein